MSSRRTARLCGPGGPWRRLHPGVVLLRDSTPTRRQLLHAAIARYGADLVITGTDALRAQGVKCRQTPDIHVLVPDSRRVTPESGLRAYRTTRLPEPLVVDGLPYAPAARAALDLARLEDEPAAIEHLVTLPLYWGLCEKAELIAELEAGNQRGSAAVRAVLRAVNEEVTYAHALASNVLAHTPLPPPAWDVTVCDRRGRRIGHADAWWDEIGLAWQYRPGSIGTDGGFAHLALTATGIVIVRCTVRQLQHKPREVVQELVRSFNQAARTPRPKVRTRQPTGNAA